MTSNKKNSTPLPASTKKLFKLSNEKKIIVKNKRIKIKKKNSL